MIFLFSDQQDGPLFEGARFMQSRNAQLHPGDCQFYRWNQAEPTHRLVVDLGPNSHFEQLDCSLTEGESVIIIGHGGAGAEGNDLFDEAGQVVTDAALRLMNKVAIDNPDGEYVLFLAACGGAVRQPQAPASLLHTLVVGSELTTCQIEQQTIQCWGYTASAGLVEIPPPALPADSERAGIHIYGTLTDAQGIEQHCGYDTQITTRLYRLPNGLFVTIVFTPGLDQLQEVETWARLGFMPTMDMAFPRLYDTLALTGLN